MVSKRILASSILVALIFIPQARFADKRGPEANLYGRDLALLRAEAALKAESWATRKDKIWVGSYLYASWSLPWAGAVQSPLRVVPFGPETTPEDLNLGDIIIRASYGEPLSRLGERNREVLEVLHQGQAWIEISEVKSGYIAAPASN